MSPARAQEIWDTRAPFGELSLTDMERSEVKKVWDRMPGHTCFVDALLRIARGQAEERPVMIGTAVFSYGGQIIDQSPVYWGETVDSPAVHARARRAVEMLGMPATDPVHGCNANLAKLGMASVKFYPRGH